MSPIDEALLELRHAVHMLDHSTDELDLIFWRGEVNQWAYQVNLAIHNEFPNHHNHPGPYRPLQTERQP